MLSAAGSAVSRRAFISRFSVGASALLVTARSRGQPTGKPVVTTSRKLGLAIVGLGGYSTGQLAPALQESEYCRLVSVVSSSREKGLQWAKFFGFPEQSIYSYETMDRLADNPAVDIVYVMTPPSTHAEFAVRAARAGKHVISEKPMATTVRDCDAMIAACREAKRQLSIGYRLHFEPHHQELKRLGTEHDFGPLLRMRGGLGFHVNQRSWRVDKKLAGGGPLPDIGTYVIQAACMAAGGRAPVAVTAREEPKTRPDFFNEVEETMVWRMEFPGGAGCDAVTSFEKGIDEFRAEGEKGWIELKPAFGYGGIVGRTSRGPMALPNVRQQTRQLDDFAQCILSGRATSVPGEMGRRDVAIIEAIYTAAASGQRTLVKA